MHRLIIPALITLFAVAPAAAVAGDNEAASENRATTVRTESEGGLFDSIWYKIRRMLPNDQQNRQSRTVATMGVRGSETTESTLQPHWEGDLSSNPEFKSEMKSFDQAQNQCTSGEAGKGAMGFESLIATSKNDSIRANSMLAVAACYNTLDNQTKSRSYLQAFVKEYPKHPMAKEVTEALRQ